MIKHLSYSSISNYLQCQRHWKHRYIDQLESEKSDALLFGSAWHKVIPFIAGKEGNYHNEWEQALYDVCLPSHGEVPNDEIPEMQALGYRMLETPSIATHMQGLKFKEAELLIDYDNHGLPFYDYEPMLELKFEMTIPQCEVPIIGYIDAILADGTAVDFKTSKTRWNQDKVDNDLQATFYVAGLHSLGLVKADDFPVPFEYHIFLKQKKPDVQVLRTHRTAADCMALFNIIGDVWKSMKNDTFLPSGVGSWKCSQNYCEFWNVCKGGMLG